MRVELESYSHNEQLARVVVAAYMTRLNPTVDETEDVKTAVSEAVTNAIIHGYQESGETLILRVSSVGGELQVEVEDHGVGIPDVEQARQPLYTTSTESGPEWDLRLWKRLWTRWRCALRRAAAHW